MIALSEERKKRKPQAPAATDVDPTFLYSAEAEKAVLGSMLMSPHEVMDQVMEKIGDEDFFVPAHRLLFKTLTELHNRGAAIDLTTVYQHLTDQKTLEAVGNSTVTDAAAAFVTHLNVSSYVDIVKDKSLLRHLRNACVEIVQLINEQPGAVRETLDVAMGKIFQVAEKEVTSQTVKASQEVNRTLEMIQRFHDNKRPLIGIDTGFSKLNELTSGWQKGDMVVLAARPGVGKTALALTFAKAAMKDRWSEEQNTFVAPGYSVGFFSLEMTNQQLILRLMASYASLSMQLIREGKLSENDMHALHMVGDSMKEMPLYLDDTSYITINQLRSKARRMQQMGNIELLIIDYLQLLHSDSSQSKDNRQNEVAEISRGIKSLAKELSIPIIVLAQLNRKSEEGKSEPALHNLRESGAIEQDADLVMLLHRPEEKEDKDAAPAPPKPVTPYKLIIAKQRNGPTDTVDMNFVRAYTRFEDPLRLSTR
jgi:replicative DNA helicase